MSRHSQGLVDEQEQKHGLTILMLVIPYSRTFPSLDPTTTLPSPDVAKQLKFVPLENCTPHSTDQAPDLVLVQTRQQNKRRRVTDSFA